MDRIRWLSMIVSIFTTASVLAVLIAIWLDFKWYGERKNTRRQKHSIVATGTMLIFFAVYYLVLRLNLGIWIPPVPWIRWLMILLGLFLVMGGAAMNIWGRLTLKQNWANHIKIYDNHQLVTTGAFRWVRHPLYSSLFFMFYGGCLIYSNWAGVLLTSFIFVPMMWFRGGQEEALLEETFGERYAAYREKTGRFLPKYKGGRR